MEMSIINYAHKDFTDFLTEKFEVLIKPMNIEFSIIFTGSVMTCFSILQEILRFFNNNFSNFEELSCFLTTTITYKELMSLYNPLYSYFPYFTTAFHFEAKFCQILSKYSTFYRIFR